GRNHEDIARIRPRRARLRGRFARRQCPDLRPARRRPRALRPGSNRHVSPAALQGSGNRRAEGRVRGNLAHVCRPNGVKPVLVEFPTPPKMVECLKSGACDVGSLGFDPTRAGDVEGFSPAFIEFDYTYLVRAGSSIRSGADADRATVRVAVVNAHASTLALARIRKQAELVSVDTPDRAFDLLRTGRVDAWASVRPILLDYSEQLPGSHVLEDRYGANRPAIVVAKGQAARLAYFSELF